MDEKKLNEIGHQFTLDEWAYIRDDIKRRLAESASNFVGIGFRLKQLKEIGQFDGCGDIFEFARKEYGLSKSAVYRFMAINSKYSEGGNSLLLREEFRNFSVSKLDEMLALPDSEIEMITEDTTISQIRELKEFNKQVAEITGQDGAAGNEDIAAAGNEEENAAAGNEDIAAAGNDENKAAAGSKETESAFPTSGNPLAGCIIDFFKDREEAFNGTMKILSENPSGLADEQVSRIADIINPSGNMSHKHGKVFVFLYDSDTGIKYKVLGSIGIVKRSWNDFIGIISDIYAEDVMAAENPHEAYYGKADEEIPDVGKTASHVIKSAFAESDSVETAEKREISKEETVSIEEKSAFAESDSVETAEKQEISEGETVSIEEKSAFAEYDSVETAEKQEVLESETASDGEKSAFAESEVEEEEESDEIDEDARRLNHRLSDLANVCGRARVEDASMSQLEYIAMSMDMTLRQLKIYIEIKKEENK